MSLTDEQSRAAAIWILVSAVVSCDALYGVGDLHGVSAAGAAGVGGAPRSSLDWWGSAGASTTTRQGTGGAGAATVPTSGTGGAGAITATVLGIGGAGTTAPPQGAGASSTAPLQGGGASPTAARGGSSATGGTGANTAVVQGSGGVSTASSLQGVGAISATPRGGTSATGGAGVSSSAISQGGTGGATVATATTRAGTGGYTGVIGGGGVGQGGGRGGASGSPATGTGGIQTGGVVIGQDRFGIQMLYPGLVLGQQWHAQWDTPTRSFNDRDPNDEWVEVRQGNGTFDVDGDGALRISGDWPRLDVRDPQLIRQWRDVEITIYFRRVADENPSWGGIMSVARTNHGIVGAVSATQNRCDTRGIGVRLRYDGQIEFVKETSHYLLGSSDFADLTTIAQSAGWTGGIPHDRWIGYKHIVYDLPDGSVKQELWIDETGGVNGGTWLKRDEYLDAGGVFGKGGAPCSSGIDPTLPLTNSPDREGSETGLPNITVYFQSQAVATDGLLYKWGSVREIVASP